MRLARIAHPQGFAFVEIRGDLTASAEQISCAEIAEHPFGRPEFTGRQWPLSEVRLLAPILASKVVCVGKNYADHAREMGSEPPAEPLLFLKPNTSVAGPGSPIVCPPSSRQVEHEGELAVVIGQPCRKVSAARAHEVILGYTCANDVTARDQQRADGQWTRAKGYDTFCPLGPWIVTDLDPNGLDVRTTVTRADGSSELRQDGNTSQFMHTIGEIIEYVTSVMTLLPGDVVLTGTPAGVGSLEPGDTVSVEIEGIGTLSNPVARG